MKNEVSTRRKRKECREMESEVRLRGSGEIALSLAL